MVCWKNQNNLTLLSENHNWEGLSASVQKPFRISGRAIKCQLQLFGGTWMSLALNPSYLFALNSGGFQVSLHLVPPLLSYRRQRFQCQLDPWTSKSQLPLVHRRELTP